MDDLAWIFSREGPLARTIAHYQPRGGQLGMALAVESAIANRQTLLAEAGTGTGKTFSYLVPAIRSGQRVIVSTGTRNLQDQLFGKDLPLVRKALGVPIRAALLKGRANYLCHYRLRAALDFRIGQRVRDAAELETVRRWAALTTKGDKAEVTDVADDSSIWRVVTSTTDNCLGQACPDYATCFVAASRRRAHEAQLVVVNHHLLWADWAIKTDGLGELLPKADVVIVDEAHQFLDTASQFLGVNVGSRTLEACAEDLLTELAKYPGEFAGIGEDAAALKRAVHDARDALGPAAERVAWGEAYGLPCVKETFAALCARLAGLAEQARPIVERSAGLDSCWRRLVALQARLDEFRIAEEQPHCVRWIETHRNSFHLYETPIDIAETFAEFHADSDAIWIFTSATLSGDGQLDAAARAFGLDEATMFRCDSPFDYRRQCLFYVPSGLPEPGSMDYTERVIAAVLPVLAASGGRAFLLFTSHQAMNRSAELLRQANLNYPLFVQGSQPKTQLLQLFQRSGRGVLLGTQSFWEGVDVPGPSLSCVIIDKLPFAAPSDPILSARIQSIRSRGEDPFNTLQLPTAALALRQGFGRLIRAVDDRGVFVLCDPRIVSRGYGRRFLAGLPDMPLTRHIGDVEAFFRDEEAVGATAS